MCKRLDDLDPFDCLILLCRYDIHNADVEAVQLLDHNQS